MAIGDHSGGKGRHEIVPLTDQLKIASGHTEGDHSKAFVLFRLVGGEYAASIQPALRLALQMIAKAVGADIIRVMTERLVEFGLDRSDANRIANDVASAVSANFG